MPSAPEPSELNRPVKRGGRMSEAAVVEETPVWLEVNGVPLVTWMCTPDLLEELALGWLHGEGYIRSIDEVRLRPCSTDLGFWATIPDDRFESVRAENRRPVLASGCGAVATYLADANSAPVLRSRPPVELPETDRLRQLFKAMFQQGERYRDTGGIHAAAITDGTALLAHAEDIGRHNAVDKVIGARVLERLPIVGLGLMVTGRISAELAFKAARAGITWVATPSVPSSLAVEIATRTGMVLVGRAVSGTPGYHGAVSRLVSRDS
jgi:FdhD protein